MLNPGRNTALDVLAAYSTGSPRHTSHHNAHGYSAASGMTVAAPRKAMTYNKLGSSDLLVSSCCLGTRASSKCLGSQPRMRPPGSAEARPLAPWTQRAAPRHVGALGWPPKPGSELG